MQITFQRLGAKLMEMLVIYKRNWSKTQINECLLINLIKFFDQAYTVWGINNFDFHVGSRSSVVNVQKLCAMKKCSLSKMDDFYSTFKFFFPSRCLYGPVYKTVKFFLFCFLYRLNQITTSKTFLVENMNNLHHCESWIWDAFMFLLSTLLKRVLGP